MSLNVPTPDPPAIYRGFRDEEYQSDISKRADIQEYFDGMENAWGEAFGEWASETGLTEGEYRAMLDLGFLASLDFHYDELAREVTYEAPQIPDDWKTVDKFSALDSWSTVSAINEEIDELGETVAGVLTNYYIAWESEADVVETFGNQFNARDEVLTDMQNAREDE